MKKILIASSLASLAFWFTGYFIFHFSTVIHAALILSMVVFLRSIFVFTENDIPIPGRE